MSLWVKLGVNVQAPVLPEFINPARITTIAAWL